MAGNIRTYDAPQGLGINPTEMGIDATVNAAKRIGGFYNQVADAYNTVAGLKNDEGNRIAGAVKDVGQVAVDYEDHREINAGAAKGTELMANATASWNKIISDPKIDPNDPAIAQKFMAEQLQPALDQFQQGFNTEKSQQFAEQFVDRFRNHMSEKTTADMMGLAKIAVTTNIEKTQNALGSMVANDPSSLDAALETYRHTVDASVGSSPTLDGVTKAAVRGEIGLKGQEAIVKSAISGMITKNPNIDLDAIQKKYGEYIKVDEMKMFQKAAQSQAKVDFLQNKAMEAYQDKQRERAAGADLSKTFSDNVQFGADGKVTINPKFYDGVMQTVRKYPGSADDTARALIQFGEHQQAVKRETIVTDPTVQGDLLGRMTDPNNPTTETQILQRSNEEKLDPHTTSNLLALRKAYDEVPIKDPVFSHVMQAAKGVMEQSLDGQENYGKFAFQFMSEYQRLSRAGQLKPDDLDMNKPDSLISKTMAANGKPTIADRAQYHLFKNLGANPADIDFTNVTGTKGGGAPVPAVKVATPADAAKLKSGTRYTTPDGKEFVR